MTPGKTIALALVIILATPFVALAWVLAIIMGARISPVLAVVAFAGPFVAWGLVLNHKRLGGAQPRKTP